MDTNEILGYFANMTRCRPYAQYEVVPSDKLKHVIIHRYPFIACVNLDEAHKPGSHWTGLYISRQGGELEFLDSYGISINDYPKYFINFAVNNNLRLLENRKMLQSPSSAVCGHYVVMYMYKRLQGCSRQAFYNHFSNNLNRNDEIVFKFVKKLLIKKSKSCKYFQTCKSKT